MSFVAALRGAAIFFFGVSFVCWVSACSSVSYRYVPDKKLTYTRQVRGKTLTTDLDPLYHDLEKSGKISVYFIFSETQANWKNLEQVELNLFDGDKKIALKRNHLKIEYWDGKNRPAIQKENFTGSLSALFPAELAAYQYNDSMSATFTYELEFEIPNFPDALAQKITVRFADKSMNFENTLMKKKFEKPFISGRPFG